MRNLGKAELEALNRDVDLVSLVRSYGIELRKRGRSFLGRSCWNSTDRR